MRWKVSIPITSCSRFDLVEATQTAFLWKLKTVAVGIEDPTKVFDPFFTTKEIGRGVGLSVCRSIIQSHGGELWAESAGDQGTKFWFTLPIGPSRDPAD